MIQGPARSWVPVPDGSDFPLENLPFGVFSRPGEPARVGVAIGAEILDVSLLAAEGLLEPALERAPQVFAAPNLNAFIERGPPAWRAVRRRLTELLAAGDRAIRDAGLAEPALADQRAVQLHLPVAVADFVDFYSSEHHAANLGRMFRPGQEPLLPNWRRLPVGYHGRAGTVVPSGTPIVRPTGQLPPAGSDRPALGPTRRMDFELEVGFIAGPGTRLGEPVPIRRAEEHIFGFVLVNDWSARDIQAWEYQPLGPFLGKSFATSISPWVVTLEALAPYRRPGPAQDQHPLEYLDIRGDAAIDLHLEVDLVSRAMVEADLTPVVIARGEFRDLYWVPAQQLAHATVNGASIRTGDLYASGTVSGEDAAAAEAAAGPPALGSMIELTLNGQRPLRLPDGSQRAFLEDGDTVRMRGWCGGADLPRVGFGEVRGTILPAASV